MLILYHRGLPRWTCTPRLQGPWVQQSRIPCSWSIGNHYLEDTCRQCASHLVHHMYGGSSTSGGTCQIWHAIPQEWWGRSSPRACTHRWLLGRPLWRRVTGCCGGPSIRTSWLNTCKVSASFRPGSRGSLYQVCCLVILGPTLASSSSNISEASAWSSWRIFGPRFGAPPEAGRRGQTAVACRSMVSPRLHVFFLFFFFFSSFFWFCYLGCGELPNRSDHTGVGEELPPSSLVGGPRRTEEELEMGTYIIIHFLKTLAIRWGYANHTLVVR